MITIMKEISWNGRKKSGNKFKFYLRTCWKCGNIHKNNCKFGKVCDNCKKIYPRYRRLKKILEDKKIGL